MVKISINEHWILHLRFGKWYEALETESQIPWARRVFWTAFVSLMLLLQFAYLGKVGSSSGRWFPTFVSFVVFEIVGRLWTFLLFVIVRCPQSAVWPISIEISGELAGFVLQLHCFSVNLNSMRCNNEIFLSICTVSTKRCRWNKVDENGQPHPSAYYNFLQIQGKERRLYLCSYAEYRQVQ